MNSELLKKIGTLGAAIGFIFNGACKVGSALMEVKAAGEKPTVNKVVGKAAKEMIKETIE